MCIISPASDYMLTNIHECGKIRLKGGALADSSGAAKRYNYTAYGIEYYKTASTNPFRYCGEYYDEESGQIYLRARYYDPYTAQFISEDPIRDGANWYAYCSGNPVMYVDPSGLLDVMLRYIAEKNNGIVRYNAEKGTATVTIGDITKEYDGNIINDRMIVDHTDLMLDFGLSKEQALHQEGDRFDSANDAALAFSLMYYTKSRYERQEYGAVINQETYKRNSYKYYYSNVTNSAETHNKNINELKFTERNSVEVDLDENSISEIHTHWRLNGNENFSDPNDYYAYKIDRIKSLYLLNRNGAIMYSYRDSSDLGYVKGYEIMRIR